MPAYSHLNLNDNEAREVDRFDPRRRGGFPLEAAAARVSIKFQFDPFKSCRAEYERRFRNW